MISDKDFQKAAALVKRVVPRDEWENFLGAFAAYTNQKIGEVVVASPDIVIVRQGMARQCQALLQLLANCDPPEGPRGTKP